jgi:protein-disulfide isomerase
MTPRRFLALLLGLAVAGAGTLIFAARRGDAPRAAALQVDPDGVITWTIGADDAAVEVWEGSDYQCPDCSTYEAEAMPEIRRRFIETGKVRWRYLLFALPNHAEAGPATHAFACALEQGDSAAGAMHRALFETRDQWARSPGHLAVFRGIAESGGMDVTAFDACMAAGRYRDAVARTWAEAQRVGIPGTPTILLYGRFYVGGLTANQLERVLSRPPQPAVE